MQQLTEEQKRRAAENYHLIPSFLRANKLPDDYSGICSLALCRATQSFNPMRKTKFSTWAYICMLSAVRNEITREKRQAVYIEFSEETTNVNRFDLSGISRPETEEFLKIVRKYLQRRDYEIMLRIISGETQKNVGMAMSIHQSSVSRALKRIRETITNLKDEFA